MKVKQLKSILKDIDDDLDIVFWHWGRWDYCALTSSDVGIKKLFVNDGHAYDPVDETPGNCDLLVFFGDE